MRRAAVVVSVLGILACSGLTEPRYLPREMVAEVPADHDVAPDTQRVVAWYGSMDPIHCAGCPTDAVDALVTRREASTSAAADGPRSHLVVAAFDRDPKTAWCADPGKGEGEWIEVGFSAPIDVEGIEVRGGWFDGEYQLFRHERVAALYVVPDVAPPAFVTIQDAPRGTTVQAATMEHPVTVDIGGWKAVRSIRFEIRDTWPGRDGKGVCISSLDVVGRPTAP